MKKIVVQLFMFTLLLSTTAQAELAVPPLTVRVTDLTNTLTAEQLVALESRLEDFESRNASQLAVLIVSSTQAESIEHYSTRVVQEWKLNPSKTGNGVLLLLAKDDHKVYMNVGYGLAGALPDAVVRSIVADEIAPLFERGKYYTGIVAGVSRIITIVQEASLASPPPCSGDSASLKLFYPFLILGSLISGTIFRKYMGRFLGAVVNAGLTVVAVTLLGGGIPIALVFAIMAFAFARGIWRGFGGGLSRDGGGFGGGSASGSW